MRRRHALLLALLPAVAGCAAPAQDPLAGSQGEARADFRVAPAEGGRGTAFTFEALAPRGEGWSYAWDFGDGATAEGRVVTHRYDFTNAVLGVTLTARGPDGAAVRVRPLELGTGRNTLPEVALALPTRWVGVGQLLNASAVGTSDPDGDALTLLWGASYHGLEAPGSAAHHHDGAGHGPGAGGDRAAYRPQDNGFDSPPVEPGEAYEGSLRRPGLYVYHCHPHPWMTGSLLVTPDAPSEPRHLAMWDVRWFLPRDVAVAPGTALRWVNEDPVWHTVTLSEFHPADSLQASGDSHTFRFDQEGVHEVTLVARDAKGAVNATSQLVLVTREPPATSLEQDWSGAFDTALPNATRDQLFSMPHKGNATFEFTWGSPSPLAEARLEVFRGARPSGEPLLGLDSGTGEVALPKGGYVFRVTAETAVQLTYQVRLRATLEPEPDFGGEEQPHTHG